MVREDRLTFVDEKLKNLTCCVPPHSIHQWPLSPASMIGSSTACELEAHQIDSSTHLRLPLLCRRLAEGLCNEWIQQPQPRWDEKATFHKEWDVSKAYFFRQIIFSGSSKENIRSQLKSIWHGIVVTSDGLLKFARKQMCQCNIFLYFIRHCAHGCLLNLYSK